MKNMRRLKGLLAAALLSLPLATQAKIDLVTLPASDSTQVTIYKSQDLTLVRETRTLTMSKGTNEIQFSWANTLIDPTSLHLRVVDNSPNFTLLDASYPANTQNTIIWYIEAASEGQAKVEISYFASGLSWQADYSATANADETKLTLAPNFTITNNSGEDMENAQTRLVVGEINLVEAIRILAERGIITRDDMVVAQRAAATSMMKMEDRSRFAEAYDMAFAGAPMPEEAKEILKAAVSEYYLYTIDGTENLETGWGKQLPDPIITDIPIEVSYEYNPAKYGNQVVKFYKFKNDEEHELGADPLPEGTYYVYSEDGRDGLRFESRTTHKYIPIGEDIELQLGSDGMVLYEERIMDVERKNFDFSNENNVIGHDVVTKIELEIRNSRDRQIPMKIRRQFSGDWEITESSDDYKMIDQNNIELELDVPALGKKVVSITYVEHHGTRSHVKN